MASSDAHLLRLRTAQPPMPFIAPSFAASSSPSLVVDTRTASSSAPYLSLTPQPSPPGGAPPYVSLPEAIRRSTPPASSTSTIITGGGSGRSGGGPDGTIGESADNADVGSSTQQVVFGGTTVVLPQRNSGGGDAAAAAVHGARAPRQRVPGSGVVVPPGGVRGRGCDLRSWPEVSCTPPTSRTAASTADAHAGFAVHPVSGGGFSGGGRGSPARDKVGP